MAAIVGWLHCGRMWTLFGSNGSGSAAVEMALVLCERPYRVQRASAWEADSDQAGLARLNPLGQIPTLVLADGLVMSESAAILAHLGLTHPASGLLPAREAERAQALRGLVFMAANCYATIGIIDYPERWLPDGSEVELKRLRAGARTRLHGYWSVFAAQFPAAGTHLGGERPGALDLLAAVVSRWAGARAHLLQHHAELHALLLRTEAHPQLAPVFRRHWPAT
jgi:GST-like protein